MSSGTMIRIATDSPMGQQRVSIHTTPARAELLFHDLNRLLSLLDTLAPNLMDGRDPDAGDQAAYDRTNEVLAQLQRELGIEPT